MTEIQRVKNTLEDAVVARDINREEMIQEAKNRQARLEETKNNFFDTLTSGYQAFQGAVKNYNQPTQPTSSSNPFGQSYNPYGQQPSNPYGAGYGGYQGSNFGSPYGSPYGAPYGGQPGAPYGGQQQGAGAGFNNMGSNMYPQFPQYPGMPYPQQPGPGYPRGY
jgi:hypothetical protein